MHRRTLLTAAALGHPLWAQAGVQQPIRPPAAVSPFQRWLGTSRFGLYCDPWGRLAYLSYGGPHWGEPLYPEVLGRTGMFFAPARQFITPELTGALAFDQVGSGWASSHFEVAGFAIELLQIVQDEPGGRYSELVQRYALRNLSGTQRPFHLVHYLDVMFWPSNDQGSANHGLVHPDGSALLAYSTLFKSAAPHVGLLVQGEGTPAGYAIAEDHWASSNLPQDIPKALGLPADRLNRVHGDADGDGRTDSGQFMLSAGLALQRSMVLRRGGNAQQVTVRIRVGNGNRF